MGDGEGNASPPFADQFYMEIGQKVHPAITPIPELLQLSLSIKIIRENNASFAVGNVHVLTATI